MTTKFRRSNRNGFSLITVLFGLASISVLLGASILAMTTNVRVNAHQANQIQDYQTAESALISSASLVLSSLAEGAEPLVDGRFIVSPGANTAWVEIRDAAGLIDVNTSSPQLLSTLFQRQRIDSSRLQDLIAYRNSGSRLQSVEDSLRAAGLSAQEATSVRPYLTTYSGRTGIDPESAPMMLLDILLEQSGDRGALAAKLPGEWKAPATRRAFVIDFFRNEASDRFASATIIVTTGAAPRLQVLDLFLM